MHRFIKGLGHAIDGIKILIQEEFNYVIHLIVAVLVIAVGLWLKLSTLEWCVIVLTIASVIVTETFNTAIENIMDFISIKRSAKIKRIKDLAAAAVLITAIASVVIGLIIFLPKIINLLQ